MSFTIYKSSAGSGKTFTLVREYLTLVLENPWKYKRILAITFTNKAANEMKERVIKSLLQIGNHEMVPMTGTTLVMFEQLKIKLSLPEEQLIANAQKVTRLILHNYADFAISTIDSFIHRVIRSFAFDLRIPMGFEVELDTKETLRRIVDLLINRAGTDENLTRVLINFTQLKTEDEKSWNIEEDIFEVASLLLDEDSQLQVKALQKLSISDFLKIYSNLSRFIGEYESMLQKLASRTMQMIKQIGVEEEAFYRGQYGIYAWFNRLSNSDFSKQAPNSYVSTTVEQDKWHSGRATQVDKNAIDSIKVQLSDLYMEITQLIEKKYERYQVSRLARQNLYPLAILHEIEKILDDYKNENNILLISEFNKRISEVVMNEPVPFIYERIGEKFQHYLVDEFQDTSILQWQNLLPLIENSMATGNFNMIVGDAKQAIYRWRSGEVEQFISLPKLYKAGQLPLKHEREAILERNHIPMELKNNFRSAEKLVRFNNDFFKITAELLPEKYKSIYENADQLAGTANPGGFVKVEFYDRDNNELKRDEFYLERTVDIIRNNFDLNYHPGDIAVLCRNNAHASAIAAYLLQHKIPVVSSESLLLSASINVRAVISIARILVFPDDSIARIELINWLQQTGKAEKNWTSQIEKLIKNSDEKKSSKSLFESLKEFGIQIGINRLLEFSVYEFCEEVIRSFGMQKDQDPYLPFFLDAVLGQMKDPAFDLKMMVEWWDHKKDKLSILVPDEVNAVKVMTIHKSKGLEFPVVIYPYATEKLKISKDKLWIDPGDIIPELNTALLDASDVLEGTRFEESYLEEKNKSLLDLMNVLYVVMTRAADRLYILSEKPPKKSETVSVPVIFKHYLQSNGIWDDESLIYEFGDEKSANRNSSDRKPEKQKAFQLTHSIDWRKMVSLSLQAPDYWDIEHPASDQEWGTLIHKVLSQIRHIDDVDLVVQEFVSIGLLENSIAEKIIKQLKSFLSHPDVKPYFNPHLNSLEEVDLLLPNGDLQRPDRIIIADDQITIVDYKTGRKSDSHVDQVKKYLKTLKDIGYHRVNGVLLYLFESNPVVKV